jgi:hypothetical protein
MIHRKKLLFCVIRNLTSHKKHQIYNWWRTVYYIDLNKTITKDKTQGTNELAEE